jgi:hypothetical protein
MQRPPLLADLVPYDISCSEKRRMYLELCHFGAVEGIENAVQAVQDVTSSKMTGRPNGVLRRVSV